jgi:hypothetical protein
LPQSTHLKTEGLGIEQRHSFLKFREIGDAIDGDFQVFQAD